MVCSSRINFTFLSKLTSQEIGWEERLQYQLSLFSVEWDVKLNQSIWTIDILSCFH